MRTHRFACRIERAVVLESEVSKNLARNFFVTNQCIANAMSNCASRAAIKIGGRASAVLRGAVHAARCRSCVDYTLGASIARSRSRANRRYQLDRFGWRRTDLRDLRRAQKIAAREREKTRLASRGVRRKKSRASCVQCTRRGAKIRTW
ncbi:MAG: hypothetical protein V4723_18615 [Pseudomonadota bacterium]